MGLSPQLITDDLYKDIKEDYEQLDAISRKAIRLRAMMAAKECGVGLAVKAFGISRSTLQLWANRYIQEGPEGLEYKRGRGRKSHLQEIHYDAIKHWVQENNGITLRELVIKLKENFKIQTSLPSVHRAMKKLNLSYITPRPVHHKQDKGLQDEFKKKSQETDG